MNKSNFKEYRLLKSIDELKDQSFFLSQVNSRLFDRILFPIGDYLKKDIRILSDQIGLRRVAHKKSSTGICFIGKRKFSKFIDEYLPSKYGQIIDFDDGSNLGEHSGIHHFTVGQRIVIRDDLNVKKKAYFIAKKDFVTNTILVVYRQISPLSTFVDFIIKSLYK